MAQSKLPAGITPRQNSIKITFAVKGKRYFETLRIPPTHRNIHTVAVKKRAELIAHVDEHGSLRGAEKPTVAEYLDKWLTIVEGQVSSGMFTQYVGYVRRLKEPFGDIPVDELTVGDVRDFCATMANKGRTGKTIRNTISPVRQMLSSAVEDGVVASNILSGWSYKVKRIISKKKVDPFTKLEQAAILAELVPAVRNYYQFSFWTGLRPSEAIALTWDDVNFKKQTVHIDKSKTQYTSEADATKTEGSERDIKLLKPALEALKNQRELTLLQGKQVFLHPVTNEPFKSSEDLLRYFWKPALKRAGVRYRKAYQTRHTFASMMVSSGEHPQWVANMMGHADWTMIATTYSDWMPEAMPDAGSKAEKLFG